MRRVLALVATTALLLTGGCGGRSYDIRLEKTYEAMKYKRRLDDNLIPAPKGKFESLLIFIRPPKNLTSSKEFLLGAPDAGQFDLTESFLEPDKQSLHVLARVKRPKAATKKKADAKPEIVIPPGKLGADVVALLNSVYGVEQDVTKAKEVSEKDNVYRHLKFEGNGKVVQLYLNVVKGAPYEVAIIFEYPKTEESNLVSKIKLCLESFATGVRAQKAFAGNATEEEGGEAGSAPPVAF